MTSTDFAARYRLLKNVATRGARSFLAQQVELGRMVMVHYLDSENLEERAATLARLEALRPPGRDKLLEIADVDGTPVAVTLFISSFKDFETWLDAVGAATPPKPAAPAAPQAGEFTRAFKVEPAAAPVASSAPVEPPRAPEPPKKAPGEFTRIFGKVDEATLAPNAPPSPAKAPAAARHEEEIPTVIMEAVKPPHTAPKPQVPEPAPAADSGSSFTAIFGAMNSAPSAAPNFPPAAPNAKPAPAPVMPPLPPAPDLRPSTPSPVPQPPAAQQPGEFTQLFQRLSPSGGTAMPSSPLPAVPFVSPEVPRPFEPTPRADFAPPSPPAAPAVPSLGVPALGLPALGSSLAGGASLGPAPATKLPDPALHNGSGMAAAPPIMPPLPSVPSAPSAPPRSWAAPAAPPPIGASVFGNSGPSEFTRILSPIAAPPPPPVSIQPPTASAQAAGAAGSKSKSMLPLIIGLAAVVLITVVMVVYFVVRG